MKKFLLIILLLGNQTFFCNLPDGYKIIVGSLNKLHEETINGSTQISYEALASLHLDASKILKQAGKTDLAQRHQFLYSLLVFMIEHRKALMEGSKVLCNFSKNFL